MRILSISFIALLIAGCGGESDKDSSASGDNTSLTGVLVDSPVEGIGYRTATKTGFTNVRGEFNYAQGETVTFFIGDLELPPVSAKAVITPLDIANTNEIDNQTAVNISILLQSLDIDADPSNGIRIDYDELKVAAEEIEFKQDVDNFRTAIVELASTAGNSVVTKANAVEHLQGTLQTLDISFSSSSEESVSSGAVSSSSTSTAMIASSEKSVASSVKPVSSISNSVVVMSSINSTAISSKAASSEKSVASSVKPISSINNSVVAVSSTVTAASSKSSSSKSSSAGTSKSSNSSSVKSLSSTSKSLSSKSSSSSTASYAYVVNDSAELATAMNTVTAGQSILLNDGNYSDLVITKQWTDYVTLKAANKHQAIFNTITMDGANKGYVIFDGVSAHSFDVINNAHHLKIINSLVRRIIYFKYANNIEVRNTQVRTYLSGTTGSTHSVLANHVKQAMFEHNIFSGATQDLMRITGDSDQIVIRKNMFYNTIPNDRPDLMEAGPCEYDHTDALQGFGSDGFNPRNLTIESNFFYDDPSDNEIRRLECTGGTAKRLHMQGVFLSDPKGEGFVNVRIRNNYFYLGSPNTIYINSATDYIVENNTLLGWNGGGGGSIRVVDKAGFTNAGLILRNNIARAISDESETWIKPASDENATYNAADVMNYFQISGEGDTWQDFLPVPGSQADIHGAFQELRDIADGVSPPPGPLN